MEGGELMVRGPTDRAAFQVTYSANSCVIAEGTLRWVDPVERVLGPVVLVKNESFRER